MTIYDINNDTLPGWERSTEMILFSSAVSGATTCAPSDWQVTSASCFFLGVWVVGM